MSPEENSPVRVMLDKDGYVIKAGDPSINDRKHSIEMLNIIKEGGSVKTVPFNEYLTLPWAWDKPKK